MHKPIKKIGLLVLTILVLPITAFFIYQFASLSESEEEVNKIYIQQLETILFSINQYSEDVISNWSNEFRNDRERILTRTNMDKFLSENLSIKTFFTADTNSNSISIDINSIGHETELEDSIKNVLNKNKILVSRLYNYLDVGYEKIEPLGNILNEDLYICLFALDNNSNGKRIGGLVFDSNEFIIGNLVPKIAQACGDEFVLKVIRDSDKSIIHSCEDDSSSEITLLKPLWLLPGISLGIKMKGGNIEELVSQRFYTNFIVLILLLFILLLGIAIIYYNLKKELKLTQLKSDFISNVSHELRTPLALINMYSETLVLDRIQDEKKKQEYYSVINSETNRLAKIVNSILNFSKMESGTRIYNFEAHNLVLINEEVIRTYDFHIKSKGFKYSINNNGEIENNFVDIDAISESIINLIDNSMKYSSDRKEFIINIGENNIGPFWEIKDFGIGISSDDKLKIFDKFYRVTSGLLHTTKGTGLGLSLVKQIMAAHDGDITVSSELGEGSTFRLQFNKNFKV